MAVHERPILVIGDKNYSSWSMRAWLALTAAGIDFEEMHVKLRTEETRATILRHSPSGTVPALKLGAVVIPESLAICEWAAEQSRSGPLLPEDGVARAVCRAVSAEMHSGFATLRKECPMEVLAVHIGHPMSDACRIDIARIEAVAGRPVPRDKIAVFADQGWVNFDGATLSLTPSGRLLADAITAQLVP